jgi:hypothetical protein
MAAFPPAARDLQRQQGFAPLGLTEEDSPYLDPVSDLTVTLSAAGRQASEALAGSLRSLGAGLQNGWHLGLHMLDFNADFFEVGTIGTDEWIIDDRETAILQRAQVALGGLWGNHAYEAAYATTHLDDRGDQLTGDHAYTLTLDPPPPAQAFWSLTMYDVPNYYLVGNPIDRYSVGDRTPGVVTGPGGMISITIARDEPTDTEARANWLPAPQGPFRPCLRMYSPAPDVLEGRYALPPITRIS